MAFIPRDVSRLVLISEELVFLPSFLIRGVQVSNARCGVEGVGLTTGIEEAERRAAQSTVSGHDGKPYRLCDLQRL